MLKNLFILLLLTTACACGNKCKTDSKTNSDDKNTLQKSQIKIISPQNNSKVKFGETIEISFQMPDTINFDTVILFVDNKETARFSGNKYNYLMTEKKVGNKTVRLSVRKQGREIDNAVFVLKYFPDKPKLYKYKIVKIYPHNSDFYTQGLFFYNGFLYEGTGQNGKSALMKINLKTGNAEKTVRLDNDFFGEGITVFDDKIYQLTWQQRKCFVYDLNTFENIETLSYTNEGWGITTINDLLVFSDGSPALHFVEPANFAEVNHLQVCDNNGYVTALNELEYIDGKIWANVWTKNYIVIINPETGAVEGKIDLSGIYDKATEDECLNGIAYDKNLKRIFVTGKHWNELFEVKIVEN